MRRVDWRRGSLAKFAIMRRASSFVRRLFIRGTSRHQRLPQRINVRFGWWIQPVDATLYLILSAGV
jgi:hypothetical protein